MYEWMVEQWAPWHATFMVFYVNGETKDRRVLNNLFKHINPTDTKLYKKVCWVIFQLWHRSLESFSPTFVPFHCLFPHSLAFQSTPFIIYNPFSSFSLQKSNSIFLLVHLSTITSIVIIIQTSALLPWFICIYVNNFSMCDLDENNCKLRWDFSFLLQHLTILCMYVWSELHYCGWFSHIFDDVVLIIHKETFSHLWKNSLSIKLTFFGIFDVVLTLHPHTTCISKMKLNFISNNSNKKILSNYMRWLCIIWYHCTLLATKFLILIYYSPTNISYFISLSSLYSPRSISPF